MTPVEQVGLALAVLSILVTIYIGYRFADRKRPRYYITAVRRIESSEQNPSAIEVTFARTRVPRVTSTFVWLWNAGRKPIRQEDVPDGNALTISLGTQEEEEKDEVKDEAEKAYEEMVNERKVKLLACSVEKVSRDAIRASVSRINDQQVQLGFQFLDYGDGFVVELLHTGDVRTPVSLSGIILGAPSGLKRARGRRVYGNPEAFYDPIPRRPWLKKVVLSLAAITLGAVMAFVVGWRGSRAVPPERMTQLIASNADSAAAARINQALAAERLVLSQNEWKRGLFVGGVYCLPLLLLIWISGPPHPSRLRLDPRPPLPF